MAKDFTHGFYQSKAWIDTRSAYAASKNYLCEMCLSKGLYVPGVITHHKQYITPENINDPNVTLSWDNLMLVCRDCHAELHKSDDGKRYCFDDDGNLIER